MIALRNQALFFELCERLWLVNRARDAAMRKGNWKRLRRLDRVAANLTEEILTIP